MSKKEISLVMVTMCALLVFGIFVQLRTIKNTQTPLSLSMKENELRDQVLRAQERYERLSHTVDEEEESLEKIRQQVAEKDSASAELDRKIKDANVLMGLTECKGQGVIINLDDNKLASSEGIGVLEDINDYLVHYSDLLQMINELRNAGAEAISVNDQRIVSTSGISCIGNVIGINGERVGAPFEIKAIGNPEMLYGALIRPEGYVEILERYGILKEIQKSTDITIPKYTGKYTVDHLK